MARTTAGVGKDTPRRTTQAHTSKQWRYVARYNSLPEGGGCSGFQQALPDTSQNHQDPSTSTPQPQTTKSDRAMAGLVPFQRLRRRRRPLKRANVPVDRRICLRIHSAVRQLTSCEFRSRSLYRTGKHILSSQTMACCFGSYLDGVCELYVPEILAGRRKAEASEGRRGTQTPQNFKSVHTLYSVA